MTLTESSPSTFGHYEVERVLGRGAMGTVYLARDRRIGRRVALKTITISPKQLDDSTSPQEFYTRLQREAEVSGSLVHPNIVTLYEAGYESGRISYLAMEYIEGRTLLAQMQAAAPAPLEPRTALRIIEDVLHGLAYAHGSGIIHRDIKPANILITAGGMAKVADFGIARPQNSSITAAGALMGTPNYMSPEQVLGQPLTPKADVFSTGVLLFEMLTAVKPFAAADLTGTLHNILRQPVPHASDLNAAVPRNIGDIVARLVAKSPAERPSAAEALAEIQRVRASETIEPVTAAAHVPWPGIAVGVVALVIIIAIAGARAVIRSTALPTVQIAPPQLREFEEKRRALELADDALLAGRYQESIDRYNAYLEKYPNSTTAIEGRGLATEALQRKATKHIPAKKSQHRRRSRDEDISPAEMLRRLKKVFSH